MTEAETSPEARLSARRKVQVLVGVKPMGVQVPPRALSRRHSSTTLRPDDPVEGFFVPACRRIARPRLFPLFRVLFEALDVGFQPAHVTVPFIIERLVVGTELAAEEF